MLSMLNEMNSSPRGESDRISFFTHFRATGPEVESEGRLEILQSFRVSGYQSSKASKCKFQIPFSVHFWLDPKTNQKTQEAIKEIFSDAKTAYSSIAACSFLLRKTHIRWRKRYFWNSFVEVVCLFFCFIQNC